MSPKLKNLLIRTALLVVSYASMAQTGTGGPNPPPPPTPDGRMPDIPALPGFVVPIDENIVILIALGLALGVVYFFKDRFSKA